MGKHSVYAALHDHTAFQAEHIKALLDDVAVAFGGEMLVLKFFLETFDCHAVKALRAHKPVGVDYAGKLIHSK